MILDWHSFKQLKREKLQEDYRNSQWLLEHMLSKSVGGGVSLHRAIAYDVLEGKIQATLKIRFELQYGFIYCQKVFAFTGFFQLHPFKEIHSCIFLNCFGSARFMFKLVSLLPWGWCSVEVISIYSIEKPVSSEGVMGDSGNKLQIETMHYCESHERLCLSFVSLLLIQKALSCFKRFSSNTIKLKLLKTSNFSY